MLTIRPLTAADISAFRQLRLQALQECPSAFGATVESEQALTQAQQHARLEGPSHSRLWGAWVQQRLVGSVGLSHQLHAKVQRKAVLYAVYVAPTARGTGLARPLLEAAITYARQQPGLRQLQLGVTVGNAPALHLYQSLGFVEYGREPAALRVEERYYDEILMQLELHPHCAG